MKIGRTRRAFRFFHKNAGYSSPPGRAVCAMSLVRAEQWRNMECPHVEWVNDAAPDHDIPNYTPEYVEGCVMTHPDAQVSLWGIMDCDDDYKRVVEAELALELMTLIAERRGESVLSL